MSEDCARPSAERNPGRRTAAIALLAVSVSQLTQASEPGPDHDPLAFLAALLGVAGLLISIRLATAACLESRIAGFLLAAAALVGLVLDHTVGAPGSAPSTWTALDVATIALSAAATASVIALPGSRTRALWRL